MELVDLLAVYAAFVSTAAAFQGWRTWKRVPEPVLQLTQATARLSSDGLVTITCIAANRSPFPVGIDDGSVWWSVAPPVERFEEFSPHSFAQVIETRGKDKRGHEFAVIHGVFNHGNVLVGEVSEDEDAAKQGASANDKPEPQRVTAIEYHMNRRLAPDTDEQSFPVLVPQGQGLRLKASIKQDFLPSKGFIEVLVLTNEAGRFTGEFKSPVATWLKDGHRPDLEVTLPRRPFYRRRSRRRF